MQKLSKNEVNQLLDVYDTASIPANLVIALAIGTIYLFIGVIVYHYFEHWGIIAVVCLNVALAVYFYIRSIKLYENFDKFLVKNFLKSE